MLEHNTNQKIYAAILAKSWMDASFKSTLKRDPAKVLKAHGMKLPRNASLKFSKKHQTLEWNHKTLMLPLPNKPMNHFTENVGNMNSIIVLCGK